MCGVEAVFKTHLPAWDVQKVRQTTCWIPIEEGTQFEKLSDRLINQTQAGELPLETMKPKHVVQQPVNISQHAHALVLIFML